MTAAPRFSAAVLAGGRSSRFGSDKARFVYRGKPLVAWVLGSMAASDDRFIVANRPYPEFGVPVHGDVIKGGGSMSGLHAALAYAKHAWVAVAACDLPFLTPAYWAYLLERRSHASVVMVKGEKGRLEPLAALYHKGVLPIVEERLQKGDVAMGRIAERVNAQLIPRGDVLRRFGARVLVNANRRDELT